MKKTIKIFISSPVDVVPERQKAMQIIQRLNRHFTEVELEGVFWEREPMTATEDYQGNIVYPSSTDIVAVIIWTRLGSDLSSDYVGAYTKKQPITGTEWEFEDAYAKAKKEKSPHLALYRKHNDKIVIDPKKAEEISRQQKLIEAFDDYWTKNDDGSYAMAEHSFKRTDEFESMFEEHLKKIIAKILNETLNFKANWLEGSPFRGLQSFEAQHASVFFGRKREINESREKLTQQINKGNAFLLITGASGSGKSSLVKAGLLPDLQIAGMVKDVALSRVATFIPSDDVPIKALMSAILKALPELRELQLNEENLEKHLDDLLPIEQAMNQIAKKENLSETAKVKLVLYIDQFEELFTSAKIDETMQEAFINLLFKLFSSEHVWVIASMRSDFMSYLDNFPQLIELLNDGAEYKLHFPKETELGHIINKPAQEAGLSFGIDANGKGLDDFLRESASRHQASLPLLEYLLEQLWEKRDQEKNQLTFEAYEALGKLEGAIGKKAGQVYEQLGSQEQKAMPELIIMLASVSDSSKNITAKRVSKHQIDKDPAIKACATALMAKDVRLLISAKDKEGVEYYRVAHESLFSHWELAKETILVHKKDIYLRDQLEKRSQAWKESQPKDKKSLLLNDGLPLNEALELLSRRERSLAIGVVEFVRASETKVKRAKRIKGLLIGGFIVLMTVLAFILYGLKEKAKQGEERANTYRNEAEILIDNNLFELKDELDKLGRLDLLESSQKAVGAYYEKVAKQDKTPKTLSRIMVFHGNSGDIYMTLGNANKAWEEYQKAFTIAKRLAKQEPKNTGWQRDLSVSYVKLGDFYKATGDLKHAEEEYEKALEIAKRLAKQEPKNTGWQRDLSVSYNNLGDFYQATGDLKHAEEQYRKALEIRERLAKQEPKNTGWQMDLLKSYGKFGLFYRHKKEEANALESFKQCVPIIKKILKMHPTNYEWKSIAKNVYQDISTSYALLNDEINSEAYWLKAIEIMPNKNGNKP